MCESKLLGENRAYFDKVDITQFKANNEQNVSLKKKAVFIEVFSTCNSF